MIRSCPLPAAYIRGVVSDSVELDSKSAPRSSSNCIALLHETTQQMLLTYFQRLLGAFLCCRDERSHILFIELVNRAAILTEKKL